MKEVYGVLKYDRWCPENNCCNRPVAYFSNKESAVEYCKSQENESFEYVPIRYDVND